MNDKTTKDKYRAFFSRWKKYVKYSQILADLGIPKTSFSQFMSGNDNLLTVERLKTIKKEMTNKYKEIKDDRLD